MKNIEIFVYVGLVGLALAGCGPSTPDAERGLKAASVDEAGPKKPSASADENTWGKYLAEQGKIHGKDVGMRPFIYVVPGDDSSAADARRKNEAESIVTGVGHIIVPGSLLIVGGPDAKATQAFAEGIAKDIKPGSLRDITVLIVSDAAQKDALGKALDPTEARLRVVSM